MLRNWFRFCTSVLIILIIALNAHPGLAQESTGYRVFWPNVPPETDSVSVQNFAFKADANGNPTVALIVGNYYRADREGPTAYIYDHFGLIDPNQPQKFWELRELIGGTLPSWVPANYEPVLFGVNANGRVCGDVRTAGSTSYLGFYVDINSSTPVLHPLPDFYTTSVSSSGYRVNALGEILIRGTSSGVWAENTEISIYDPDASPPALTHVRKNAAEPMLFHNATSSAPIEFNSSLEIVAHLSWSGFAYNPVIKHRVVPVDVDSNGIYLSYTDTGVTQWLSDSSKNPRVHNVTDINEFSQIAGDAVVPIRKNQTQEYAALIAPDGTMDWQIERGALEDLFGRLVPTRMTNDLNDAGDILYKYDEFLSYYMHNGDPEIKGDEILIPDLSTLIIEDSDPTGAFRNSTSLDWRLSDRDSTGFGWIAGRANGFLFLLIPEIVAAPTTYTFTSLDIPKAIPDLGTVTSTIVVPEAEDFAISDLNVTLTINHGRAQDMDVFLISPNGTRVELFTDVGGNRVNFTGTTLDDQATASITTGSAPFTGTYRPEENLSFFNTLGTRGTWTLEVTDDKATKTGTLQNWSFTVQVN